MPGLGPSHGDQSILLCHWSDLLTWLCGNAGKAVIGPCGSCARHGGRTVLFSCCRRLFTWPFQPGGGSAHLDAGRSWFLGGQGRGGSAPLPCTCPLLALGRAVDADAAAGCADPSVTGSGRCWSRRRQRMRDDTWNRAARLRDSPPRPRGFPQPLGRRWGRGHESPDLAVDPGPPVLGKPTLAGFLTARDEDWPLVCVVSGAPQTCQSGVPSPFRRKMPSQVFGG